MKLKSFILKVFLGLIFIVLCPSLKAQNIELPCPSGQRALDILSTRNPNTGGIRQYACIDSSGNLSFIGSTTPFSATGFQTEFSGPRPDDCGNITCTIPVTPAIRGIHICYDFNTISQPTNIITSTTCAGFSSLDIGSRIGLLGATGGGGTCGCEFTIATFVSSTTITVSGGPITANLTNVKGWYGTDATIPLQNWKTAINNGIPTATGLLSHQGLLTKVYGTTQAVRFINPLGTLGGLQTPPGPGWGTPEPFSANQADESLQIVGCGAYRCGIMAFSNFDWTFPSTTVNNGILYFLGWNGDTEANFSVFTPDISIAPNTSGNTGIDCLMLTDAATHQTQYSLQILNAHNTTNNLPGHCIINGSFESTYKGVSVYQSDYNGYYSAGPLTSTSFIRTTFDNMSWLPGTSGAAGQAGTVIFDGVSAGGNYQDDRITNSNINGTCAGGIANGSALVFRTNVTTTNLGNEFIVENTGICQAGSTNQFGVAVLTSSPFHLTLTNVHIKNSSAASGINLIFNQNAGNLINMVGGTLECSSCTAPIVNSGPSAIYFHGTQNLTAITGGCTGFPAGTFGMILSNTGWCGLGSWQASTFSSSSNCNSSASPSVCGSSSAGSVALAAGGTTLTVNTSAVTANSQIIILNDDSLGTRLGVTCNTTINNAWVSSRTAGTSFQITVAAAPVTNPECFSFTILN